jgi:adenylate kinase
MLGPPGAGKGTQARLLAERAAAAHVASGDLLRDAIRAGSALGAEARKYMERGQLVPDDLVLKLIEERMQQDDARRGFILDGFPRNTAQADALGAMLARAGRPIDRVIVLDVPVEEIVRRSSGRRTCRACGATYHVAFDPPRVAGRCDKCGGELYQREDDKEETVRARIKVYQQSTRPLVEYYERMGLVARISGVGRPEEIQARILKKLDQAPPSA